MGSGPPEQRGRAGIWPTTFQTTGALPQHFRQVHLKQHYANQTVHDMKVQQERLESRRHRACESLSRDTLISYTDWSLQRRFKSSKCLGILHFLHSVTSRAQPRRMRIGRSLLWHLLGWKTNQNSFSLWVNRALALGGVTLIIRVNLSEVLKCFNYVCTYSELGINYINIHQIVFFSNEVRKPAGIFFSNIDC